MSEEKIKIKDLVGNLAVPPKDMLRALRELGLQVKSTVGSISLEEAARVRDYFSGQSQQDVECTEVQRDIIVRRRRIKEPAAATVAQQPEDAAKNIEPTAGDTPLSPTEEAKADTPPETAEKPAGETKKRDKKNTSSRSAKVAKTLAPARVISRPGDEKAGTKKPAEKSGQTPDSSTDAVPATQPTEKQDESPEKNAKTSRLTRPDASATPEGSSAPTLRTPEPDKQETSDARGAGGNERRPRQETPRVKVISRPAPAFQDRSGARPAGARPAGGGFRDQQPRTDDDRAPRAHAPAGTRPGGFGQPPAAPGPGDTTRDGQSKKKRLKGRRTVDFQQGEFGRRQDENDSPRLNRGKGRRKGGRQAPQPIQQTQPLKAAKRKIRITEAIRVADMAHQMGLKANEIIKVLFGLGVMATINQSLDIDTASLVAAEFEYEVEKIGFSEDDYLPRQEEDAPESMKPRPPVVTIMGHVDHGKTSLLDAIRKSNVTGGEAGGITQHIGAYHVKTKRGEIVFLDTPGHEAFTAMRARGAQITDLVILVVAADDGVMEQTREAINHSRAANVPIMVAVNKMDKPGADPDRVLRELADLGLQAEEWGGSTIVAKVSAKTRQGLDDLLEMVALQSEIMELKANPDKPARGHIVEARLDKGRGPIATVLIQEGTLKQGDNFVCGSFSGRVRALVNDQGKKVKEGTPSHPVEVQGFEGVPEAGEEFFVLADEKLVRRIADARASKQRERELAAESKVTLETFLSQRASDQEALTLNLVIKADVQGSLEAITEALNKQSTDKVRLNIMHGGAGAITESDILLASASKAIIIGFNVRPMAKTKDIAERENVDIRFYDIIYKLVDDIKNAMTGMLAPVQREVYLGQAEVRKVFSVPKAGVIAGSYVSDGKILRNAGVRLLREGVVIYTGKIGSLKRFKDDAREVVKGNECGVSLENFNDIKPADIIETFETVEEAATL
ncbi:MAG: translation initiation factor IF-2 [Desulfovibrio sp.]|jgi:translation initiation factor IF-2|nr:translation initiation factor IF-2 [Desulfovibrio sp.]